MAKPYCDIKNGKIQCVENGSTKTMDKLNLFGVSISPSKESKEVLEGITDTGDKYKCKVENGKIVCIRAGRYPKIETGKKIVFKGLDYIPYE